MELPECALKKVTAALMPVNCEAAVDPRPTRNHDQPSVRSFLGADHDSTRVTTSPFPVLLKIHLGHHLARTRCDLL